MHIERKRERNSIGEMMSLALCSLTLPHEIGYDLDALCVFTGQGEDERIVQPLKKYWQAKKSKNRFFLVPGFNKNEKSWKEMSLQTLTSKPYSLKRKKGLHVISHLGTTKDQAEWTIDKIQELSIQSCGIVSTPFHIVRSYATTLASMKARGIRIPIVPIVAITPPGKEIAESHMDTWDMVQGEVDRIEAYQQKGDVMSYTEFKTYIDWLWKQPLLKKYL